MKSITRDITVARKAVLLTLALFLPGGLLIVLITSSFGGRLLKGATTILQSKLYTLRIAVLLLATTAFAQTFAVGTGGNAIAPNLDTILERMREAQKENRTHLRAYSVVREYKLYQGKTESPKTRLKVRIQFLPPRVKSYDVLDSTGGMGEKVVRRILDHEMALNRDPETAEMSPPNYDFRFLGAEQLNGQNCYVLEARPKRKDKNLVKARIWVDTSSFRMLRLEGTPVTDPSFWTRDVRLFLDFGEMDGMWLPIAMEATARVRLLGSFDLVGRDHNYQIADTSARGVDDRLLPAKRDGAAAVEKKRPQGPSAVLVGASLVP